MKSPYVQNRIDEITAAFGKAFGWSGDPELEAYLAGYLIVVITGVYEDCIEHLICERAARTKDLHVTSFVRGRIENSFRNPKSEKIAGLLGEFSLGYKKEYQRRMKKPRRDALNSLIDNKNWLAHGETARMQATILYVKDYFKRSCHALVVLDDMLG